MPLSSRGRAVMFACFLSATVAAPASARPSNQTPPTTDIGTLGGNRTVAFAINDGGQVVGWSDTRRSEQRAFSWKDGRMLALGLLGASRGAGASVASAVNERGDVAGWSSTGAGNRGFLWTQGKMVDLGGLPSDFPGRLSMAFGVNNRRVVVGVSEIGYLSARAFTWSLGGMTDLGTLGGSISWGESINDQGQVVGWSELPTGERHAFVHDGRKMTDLGTKGANSWASAINNRGSVVGWRQGPGGTERAVRWETGSVSVPGRPGPSVRAIDLPTLGGKNSRAINNNDRGDVVGWSETPSGERRAVLWQNGTISSLPMLTATYDPSYGVFAGKIDINNRGVVVGERSAGKSASRTVILRP